MVELHSLERKLLRALMNEKEADIEMLQQRTGLPASSISRAALWLSSKGFLEIREKKETIMHLGSEGNRFLDKGLPERRLVSWILRMGGKCDVEEAQKLSGLEEKELSFAIGWARKKNWLQIRRKGNRTLLLVSDDPAIGTDEKLISVLGKQPLSIRDLDPLYQTALKDLNSRPNVLFLERKVDRLYRLTREGSQRGKNVKNISQELSQLTTEHIKSGKWREYTLRKYNIHAPVQKIWPGKKQAYKRFLDELKLKLVALGFEEMLGPLVEYGFFNCDALFMPQDHPAREIHDIYYVKDPAQGDLSFYSTIVENVKATHENGWKTGSLGWRYPFSLLETRRLMLRSQGTALSARMLVHPNLKIPGKYFSVSRCFRPDVVDRMHLTEFNQVEGIVVGPDLTFRDLLGILEMFAKEIAGAEKVRFRPDYFPFTEPSVELSAYKSDAGWLECGGAGMFRREVTVPLGIEVPVLAWGLGVDRLFMMRAGISDIRDLFTLNLDWLRRQRVT